jgi:predicted DNA-binding transcriptional regulator AlpA
MRTDSGEKISLDDETLYCESVISKKLVCEEKTLQAWRSRGGGPPFVKIGRLVRYRGCDVKKWIASRTVRSTSELLSRAEV